MIQKKEIKWPSESVAELRQGRTVETEARERLVEHAEEHLVVRGERRRCERVVLVRVLRVLDHLRRLRVHVCLLHAVQVVWQHVNRKLLQKLDRLPCLAEMHAQEHIHRLGLVGVIRYS